MRLPIWAVSIPTAFNLDLSFRILFMVIIGGVGSIMGFVPRRRVHYAVLPIFLDVLLTDLATQWVQSAARARGPRTMVQLPGVRCADHLSS
jgi:ABC-type branched-subunit amino acid transport system permease subunit